MESTTYKVTKFEVPDRLNEPSRGMPIFQTFNQMKKFFEKTLGKVNFVQLHHAGRTDLKSKGKDICSSKPSYYLNLKDKPVTVLFVVIYQDAEMTLEEKHEYLMNEGIIPKTHKKKWHFSPFYIYYPNMFQANYYSKILTFMHKNKPKINKLKVNPKKAQQCKYCLSFGPPGQQIKLGCVVAQCGKFCSRKSSKMVDLYRDTETFCELCDVNSVFSPIYNKMEDFIAKVLPATFETMKHADSNGSDCLLGEKSNFRSRLFSSLFINSDYASHAHHDSNNIDSGVCGIANFYGESAEEKCQSHVIHNMIPSTFELQSSHCYKADGTPGGGIESVGLFMDNASLLVCCAATTLHGGSSVKLGSICIPKRLSVIAVQHKNLSAPNHGN